MNSVAVKKVLVIGIFFIAYVLWQAIGTLSEYYSIYNYPPLHKGPIILFGDALAATSSIGFVGILEKRLDLQIEIESSASSTIESTARDAPARIRERKPSVVIFCFSDISGQTQLDDARSALDLREMIRAAQNEGAVTVILGAAREPDGGEHGLIIKRLARETHSLTVLNILSTITDNPKYWDKNMPNANGNMRIADIVAPLLEGLTFGISAMQQTGP